MTLVGVEQPSRLSCEEDLQMPLTHCQKLTIFKFYVETFNHMQGYKNYNIYYKFSREITELPIVTFRGKIVDKINRECLHF